MWRGESGVYAGRRSCMATQTAAVVYMAATLARRMGEFAATAGVNVVETSATAAAIMASARRPTRSYSGGMIGNHSIAVTAEVMITLPASERSSAARSTVQRANARAGTRAR